MAYSTNLVRASLRWLLLALFVLGGFGLTFVSIANAAVHFDAQFTLGDGLPSSFGHPGLQEKAQSFETVGVATDFDIEFSIRKFGPTVDAVRILIYSDDSGEPDIPVSGWSTDTINQVGIGNSFSNHSISLSGPPLLSATKYWVVFERTGSYSTSDYYSVEVGDSGTGDLEPNHGNLTTNPLGNWSSPYAYDVNMRIEDGVSAQLPTISNLQQFYADGATPMTTGATLKSATVVLWADADDPDGDDVRIEVEVKVLGESFDGSDTITSDLGTPLITLSATAVNLFNNEYKWRTRAVDELGTEGAWMLFSAGALAFEVDAPPLYTQVESAFPSQGATEDWEVEPYASGPSDCGVDIGDCGCAISSAVMALRGYGITTAQGGTQDVNPKTLNAYLKSQPNGYVGGWATNWYEIANWVDNDVSVAIDGTGNKWANDFNQLDFQLALQRTPLVFQNADAQSDITHFNVISEKIGSTYAVRDPFWYNTYILDQDATPDPTTIRDYNGNFEGLRVFRRPTGSPQDNDHILTALASPADTLITDPLGRRLGFDPRTGTAYEEIPDGVVFVDSISDPDGGTPPNTKGVEMVLISSPIDGEYMIEVIGTDSGTYNLDIDIQNKDGERLFESIEQETVTDMSTAFTLVYDENDETVLEVKDDAVIALPALADTYLKRRRPNKNFGTEATTWIRGKGKRKTLVQFDQQAISNAVGNGTLTSATLEMEVFDGSAGGWRHHGRRSGMHHGMNRGRMVGSYRLTQPWTELGATWNCGNDTDTSNRRPDCPDDTWEMNQRRNPSWNPTPSDEVLFTNSTTGTISWDVTQDVSDFIATTATNYGWVVRKDKDMARGRIQFHSKETALQPLLRLSITFN